MSSSFKTLEAGSGYPGVCVEPRSIIALGVRDLQWSVQIGEAERNGGKLLQRGERGGQKYRTSPIPTATRSSSEEAREV